jgi:hypothetical protein
MCDDTIGLNGERVTPSLRGKSLFLVPMNQNNFWIAGNCATQVVSQQRPDGPQAQDVEPHL